MKLSSACILRKISANIYIKPIIKYNKTDLNEILFFNKIKTQKENKTYNFLFAKNKSFFFFTNCKKTFLLFTFVEIYLLLNSLKTFFCFCIFFFSVPFKKLLSGFIQITLGFLFLLLNLLTSLLLIHFEI